MTTRHLGLDLGGTNTKIAVLERDAAGGVPTLVWSGSVPTHAERGPDGVAAVMVEAGREAIAAHGPVSTIGAGVPGPWDRDLGTIWSFPNFPGPWAGYPLRDRLAAGLGAPITFINDARAHTLAEARMGAGRGASTMAMLTLGTGIGGGLIIDGRLHLGASGTAGEIGHQTIDPDGPLCGCGNRGCVEPLAQAAAMTRTAGVSTVEEVFAGVARGDPRSLAALDQAVDALSIAIGNVVTLLVPDRVVIGGGIAEAGDVIMNPLRAGVIARTPFVPGNTDVEIVMAKLGPIAGAIGAALAGMEAG